MARQTMNLNTTGGLSQGLRQLKISITVLIVSYLKVVHIHGVIPHMACRRSGQFVIHNVFCEVLCLTLQEDICWNISTKVNRSSAENLQERFNDTLLRIIKQQITNKGRAAYICTLAVKCSLLSPTVPSPCNTVHSRLKYRYRQN